MPVPGTVPVERFWSSLKFMLQTGKGRMSLRCFRAMSATMILKYNCQHIVCRSMPDPAERDPFLQIELST